jgi:hypothetical protein
VFLVVDIATMCDAVNTVRGGTRGSIGTLKAPIADGCGPMDYGTTGAATEGDDRRRIWGSLARLGEYIIRKVI